MADHKKQHYVPRFYLKRFTANEKAINIYHWKLGKTIFGASLKDQCYRDYFYGSDLKLELALADIEGTVDEMFKVIDGTLTLPTLGSDDHYTLLMWIVLQSARTPYAADSVAESLDQMMQAIIGQHPNTPQPLIDDLRRHEIDPLQMAIRLKTPSFWLLRDMHMRLIRAPAGTSFITSDAPVASHNQLMFFRSQYGSTSGITWKGLQMFYPISSRLMIMLFDPNVYSVRATSGGFLALTDKRDVEEINVFQAAHSYGQFYFNSPNDTNFLKVVERSMPLRRFAKSRTYLGPERPRPDGLTSQIVGTSVEDVKVKVALSFIKLNQKGKDYVAHAMTEREMSMVVDRHNRMQQDYQALNQQIDAFADVLLRKKKGVRAVPSGA